MKHMGKRLGCAALATQMLVAPMAQAAAPLRELLEPTVRTGVVSRASERLSNPDVTPETFPRLKLLNNEGDQPNRVAAAEPATNSRDTITDADFSEKSEGVTVAPNVLEEQDEATPTATPEDGADAVTPTAAPEDEADAATPTATPEDGVEVTIPTAVPVDETNETTPANVASGEDAQATAVTPLEGVTEQKGDFRRKYARGNTNGDTGFYSVDTNDPDYGYLDTWNVLAIFGFGSKYRFTEMTNKGGTDLDSKYLYNIESESVDGKTWFQRRSEGMGYEVTQQEMNQNPEDWALYQPNERGYLNSPYAYGQLYSASDVWLDNVPEDTTDAEREVNFEWNQYEGGVYDDQRFIGALPDKPKADGSLTEYEQEFQVRLPRLPNKEFTGEWYVLGSKLSQGWAMDSYDQVGAEYWVDQGVTVDGKTLFPDFVTMFKYQKQLNSDSGITHQNQWNYQDLEYNSDRDGSIPFDRETSLATYQYPVYDEDLWNNLPSFDDQEYEGRMDSFKPWGIFEDEDSPTTLPLIGKWKDSSNATLTKLGLSQIREGKTEQVDIYPMSGGTAADVAAMESLTYRQLHQLDAGFEERGATNYFARLPYTVTALDWEKEDLQSYEPGSLVVATPTYEGGYTPSYTLKQTESTEGHNTNDPKNSFEDPARGLWELDGVASIPVTYQDGEGNSHGIQKLTFTVTPPDRGAAAKKYVIHFEQLRDPEMVQDPGNTPIGMIRRNVTDPKTPGYDDNSKWDAVAAEANFRDYLSFKDAAGKVYVPGDSITNNSGYIWKGAYYESAWGAGKTNIDLDAGAIVVYPNSRFDVPGFSIYDAQGTLSTGATEIDEPHTGARIQNVRWTLELTTVNTLTPEQMTDVEPVSGEWSATVRSNAGNVGTIDLTGYNVKPGVYTLKYTYTDLYDGLEHSGGTFDRKVVVLPLRGDVDLDGVVTSADGIALQTLLGDPGFSKGVVDTSADVTRSLYYYRVCDLDDNGEVNGADVEMLLRGYTPVLQDVVADDSDYFYIPLNGGAVKTPTSATVTAEPTGPAISLDYLGAGTDAPVADSRVDYDPDAPSVFWMGVQLDKATDLDAAEGTLTSLTLTMTYNSDYVVPYVPEETTWEEYILRVNPQWAGWTLWADRTEGATGITPVAHPSKANTEVPPTSGRALRELRFSVTPSSAVDKVNPLTDAAVAGAVLQVPFVLTSMPNGKADTDMQLVGLTLGPRDLVVTTNKDGKAGAALWDNQPTNYHYPDGITAPTDNINLSQTTVLAYGGSQATKLGKDLTPCYYIYIEGTEQENLVYGHGSNVPMTAYGVQEGLPDVEENRVYFRSFAGWPEIEWKDDSVKSWVNYRSTTHELTVTPKKAGTYDFTFAGYTTPFRMVVEKSPLTLTVDDARKYYGEAEATDFAFSYDATQIQSLDDGRGSNTGKGADLAGVIEGYTSPTRELLTAVGGGRVEETTPPGDYTVVIEGGSSDNYEFCYVRSDRPANADDRVSDEFGTATLTILPRPILVQKVTKDPVGTLKDKGPYISKTGYSVSGTADMGEFTFASLSDHWDLFPGFSNGKIDGVPISGDAAMAVVGEDKLELSYKAVVTRTAEDEAGGVGFVLNRESEPRDAGINEIGLTENTGTQNDRYVLKNPEVPGFTVDLKPIMLTQPFDRQAKATVEKRRMTEIRVQLQPTRISYTYGQALSLDGVMVETVYGSEEDKGQTADSLANLRSEGLEIYWVDSPGSVPTGESLKAVDGEELTVAYHNGKYLCLTDADTESVRAYIGPYQMEKRTVTLTIRTETRYYGETIRDWNITYNFTQLAEWDRRDHPQQTGRVEELDWMTDFVAPTVIPRETNDITAKPVTATTDVGRYFSVFSAASSADYKFEYVQATSAGEVGRSAEFGCAPLTIERRPILVTGIVSQAGSMYHDTKSYVVDPAKAEVGGGAAGYTSILPTQGTSYYTGDFSQYIWDGRWPLSGSAVHMDDTLPVLYHGEFLERDNEQMPYYTLRGDEPSREVKVQVTQMRLAGERSKNYLLLYPNAEAVAHGWAGASEAQSRTTGMVYLRKIEKLRLIGPTKTDYTYGEVLDLSGLAAEITYAGENGAAPEVETVSYQYISLDGVMTTTFKRLGLTVHMGALEGVEAQEGQQLSVPEHDRRFLYVTGPQYASGSVVNDRGDRPLTVAKKELRLTASDITRKYGEQNGAYAYSFDPAELVSWDRERLGGEAPVGGADALNTPSESAALASVNARYESLGAKYAFEGPQFATAANSESPARDRAYPLSLSGGSMANYTFTYTEGGIHVEKRPIRLTKVTKQPLYSVSVNAFGSDGTTPPTFSHVVCSSDKDDVVLDKVPGEGLTGEPVVNGDILSFHLGGAFEFGFIRFGEEYEVPHNVNVTSAELLPGGDNDNYILVMEPGFMLPAVGSVHRRVIKSIRVARQPNKMTYTYGEPLDLKGMLLEITYIKGNGPETETVNVDPTAMEEVYINYYPETWNVKEQTGTPPDPSLWASLVTQHPATYGDHLTIAEDETGFAHNGMYLMVTARTHGSQEFNITPAVTWDPIVVKPRELTYTLSAEDKDYDHNREAQGTIALTNVYGNDQVWVVNGTDYIDSITNPLPADYAFTSGDYHAEGGYNGVTFTFVDENVSYRLSDGHDMFEDLQDIPVEVAGIALGGHDAPNYSINAEVTTDTKQMEGRDSVPYAAIHPIPRTAPAVPTQLEVNVHTNTVKVLTDVAPGAFGDELDDMNAQLHYEYALVYENEIGGLEITDFQDDPYFGGEAVWVEEVEFVPNPNSPERPAGPPDGQILDPEDVYFNTAGRTALPRGTWVGALVRLAKTNNYQVSAGQTSFDETLAVSEEANNDEAVLEALEGAAQTAAAIVIPEPEDEKEKLTERVPGNVIKTYTYRLDLISVSEEKDEAENKVIVPTLEAVWFTDIGEYKDRDALSRVVDSRVVTRYYNYYWDAKRRNSVIYPLHLDQDIIVDMPVLDGTDSMETVETVVNRDGTVTLYVSLRSSGAINRVLPTSIDIVPGSLTLKKGGYASLGVTFNPYHTTERKIYWSSSDNSVATVSIRGVVTAVGPGTALITATSLDSDVWDTIRVTVLDDAAGGGVPGAQGGGVGGETPPDAPEEKPTAKPLPFADSLFNAGYTGAFMELFGGQFLPERLMTRRELAVVMERFLQAVEGLEPEGVETYTDLGEDPRNEAIYELDKWGVVNGIGGGLFAPNKGATRAEMSVMLCRMLRLPVGTDPNVEHAFPEDADPAHSWAWAYIDALAAAGITKGTGAATYSPERLVTRAEVAAFLSRAMVTVLDKDKGDILIPSDVKEDHWGYELILRAINGEPAVELAEEYRVAEEPEETEKTPEKDGNIPEKDEKTPKTDQGKKPSLPGSR